MEMMLRMQPLRLQAERGAVVAAQRLMLAGRWLETGVNAFGRRQMASRQLPEPTLARMTFSGLG